MDKSEIYQTLQKTIHGYCDKLTNNEVIVIVDSFVFYQDYDLDEAKKIFESFLNHFDIKETFEKHLIDRRKESCFKKVHGADLYFLEDLQTSLLVSVYNKFRNGTVRNNKRRKRTS